MKGGGFCSPGISHCLEPKWEIGNLKWCTIETNQQHHCPLCSEEEEKHTHPITPEGLCDLPVGTLQAHDRQNGMGETGKPYDLNMLSLMATQPGKKTPNLNICLQNQVMIGSLLSQGGQENGSCTCHLIQFKTWHIYQEWAGIMKSIQAVSGVNNLSPTAFVSVAAEPLIRLRYLFK